MSRAPYLARPADLAAWLRERTSQDFEAFLVEEVLTPDERPDPAQVRALLDEAAAVLDQRDAPAEMIRETRPGLAQLVQLVLGRVPEADELPDVLRALRAGAVVTCVFPRPDARPRPVVAIPLDARVQRVAGALRPGRDVVASLAQLGAALWHEEDGAQVLTFPGARTADKRAAALEERATDALHHPPLTDGATDAC